MLVTNHLNLVLKLGIIAVAAAVCCFEGSATLQVDSPNQPTSSFSHGAKKEGLAAFVFSERSKIKLGEELPIHYGVLFLGDPAKKNENVRIWPIRMATHVNNDSWFTVKGPDGKEIQSVAPGVDWPVYTDPTTSILLHRGEFHGRVCSNLGAYHKMTHPGIYTIVWTYEVQGPVGPWAGKLVSNEIRIEVAP